MKRGMDLIMEYTSEFAMNAMDPGKMSLKKHGITLMDNMPFKECYRCILPGMNQEVCDHLREMLEIGAIQPSHSHWASLVILV